MSCRLVDLYKNLHENIEDMQKSYNEIHLILDGILSSPDKSFEVVFKDIKYSFIYPSTDQEKNEMDQLRKKLIHEIFYECFTKMIDSKDNWWIVTTFACGIDPLDMQVEIIREENVSHVDPETGKLIGIPLNEDNYQIKQELEYDSPDIENF